MLHTVTGPWVAAHANHSALIPSYRRAAATELADVPRPPACPTCLAESGLADGTREHSLNAEAAGNRM
jgi:hypothetical protein